MFAKFVTHSESSLRYVYALGGGEWRGGGRLEGDRGVRINFPTH